ncbi:MAG: hypothetical protein QOE80_3684, partial [Actinomycetota bacterium]|nr:hypothetical protein [Actinomycetota bacterium]
MVGPSSGAVLRYGTWYSFAMDRRLRRLLDLLDGV